MRISRGMRGWPAAAFFLGAVSLLLAPACGGKPGPPPSGSPADPLKNPLYAKYVYGKDARTIDFATQPLALPEGPLGCAMERDRILADHLSRLGMRIRFHPFLKGADINAFLQRGDIDAAIAGDMPVLTIAGTGNVRVVALAKKGFSTIVAARPMQLADLKGKRIATALGSTAHFTLLSALATAGLEESSVTIVPLDVGEMPQALADRRIDAFSAWEPAPTIAIEKHAGYRAVFRSVNTSYLYFPRAFFEDHDEAVRAIVASAVRAVSWMRADRNNLLEAGRWTLEAAASIGGKRPELTAAQVATVTENDLVGIPSSPMIPESHFRGDGHLAKEFRFLQSRGKVPAGARWEEIVESFRTGVVREISADPAKFRLRTFDYRRE